MAQRAIRCPGCKATLKFKSDNLTGKKVKCPKCSRAFRIGGSTKKARKKPAAAPAASEEEPDEFDFGLDDYGDGTEEALPPATLPPPRGRKKKKRPVEKEISPAELPPDYRRIALIVGGSALGIAVLVGIGLLIRGMMSGGSSGFQLPTEFEKFASAQNVFSCEHPAGWEVKTGGGTGGVSVWASFVSGNVSIHIKESQGGGAVGDMSGGMNMDEGELPPELKPVAAVHDFRKTYAEAEMDRYEETPPEVIETAMGEGRISEFKAREMIIGRIYGYRVTLLQNMRQLNIFCKCKDEKLFELLKPTFQRVIKSMK